MQSDNKNNENLYVFHSFEGYLSPLKIRKQEIIKNQEKYRYDVLKEKIYGLGQNCD